MKTRQTTESECFSGGSDLVRVQVVEIDVRLAIMVPVDGDAEELARRAVDRLVDDTPLADDSTLVLRWDEIGRDRRRPGPVEFSDQLRRATDHIGRGTYREEES